MFSVACYVAIEATVDKGTVCGREQEERKPKVESVWKLQPPFPADKWTGTQRSLWFFY